MKHGFEMVWATKRKEAETAGRIQVKAIKELAVIASSSLGHENLRYVRVEF